MEKKINRFMSKEVDLGREPVKHLLFILAVPAITSQVVNALYNMVDRMYIGHIEDVGSEALTGVGICFPIIMIISAFSRHEHPFFFYVKMLLIVNSLDIFCFA